jgi:hypothetical protein
MEVTVDEDGIQSPGFVYSNKNALKPDPWLANWIWLSQEKFPELQESIFTVFCEMGTHHHAVALFRKEIFLEDGIESARAWVSADVKYRLYVNGRMAGRGPAEIGGDFGDVDPPQHWFYDQYELGHHFKSGVNIVTAEVVLQPDQMCDYSMGHGGFLFEANVNYANGHSDRIITDGTWRGIVSYAFGSHFRNPYSPGHINRYNAMNEPVGWHEPEFDMSNWPCVDVVEKAECGRWHLIPREIPPVMETRIQAKRVILPFEEHKSRIQSIDAMLRYDESCAMVTSGSPLTFWLDFGKQHVGYLHFLVEGPAEIKFQISFQEIAGKIDRTSVYTMRGGRQEFEFYNLDVFRYVQITISNFKGKPVKIYNIGCNFASYPVSYDGQFQCSDGLLNKVWDIGRWTNQMCMQAYHLDSPIHQEGLGCTGDYMIESLMNYYTFGDKWLIRQDLLRTAKSLKQKDGVMFCASYSLLWIQMLVDYYQYTGDDSLFMELLPVIDLLLLKRFEGYKGRNGLIENPPNYMFMDWVEIGGQSLHHPPQAMGQAYMNAFYYQALKNGAMISKILKDPSGESRYLKLADEAWRAFNRIFWNNERGLYIDGLNDPRPASNNPWLPENVKGTYFSQHTNSLAVLYDIAPKEKQAEIMQRVMEDRTLIQAQPYFMHFVFEALHHAGMFNKYGFDQMRRWKLLVDENRSGLKEIWYGECDYSHAWGGSPTYQMSSRVLGVTPIEPGFDVIGISPVFGDLSWAKGQIPTPKGMVNISWTKNGKNVDLVLSIPLACKAILHVPSATIMNYTPTKELLENSRGFETIEAQSGRYCILLS